MVKYLAVGTPVAIGVAGLSAYLAGPSEDTVAGSIRSSISGKDYLKILDSKNSGYGNKFKDLYSHSSKEQLVGITADKLPNGCEETLKFKVSSKTKAELDFASKGCVADTRSIKDVAKNTGGTIISELAEQTTSWQDAWTNYNDNKETKKLVITDNVFTSTQGSSNNTGGLALKIGCTSKESKLMYEFGGEEKVYEKYLSWCVKEKRVD